MIEKIEIGKRSSVPVLVMTVATGIASNGSVYQKLTVKDIDAERVTIMNFNKPVNEKNIINAVIECVDYNCKKSYQLKDWTSDNSLTLKDFLPKAEIDEKQTWKLVTAKIRTINNANLCRLVCKVLWNDNKEFIAFPVSADSTYSRAAGILEATNKLMELADTTATVMGLDRDIMLAASAIYYVGSIEMSTVEFRPTPKTVLSSNSIITHDRLVKARELLKEDEMVDDETFQILDNIILTRSYEQSGATIEAKVIQLLNMIVMKVDDGNRILKGLQEEEFLDNYKSHWYKRKFSEALMKEETA